MDQFEVKEAIESFGICRNQLNGKYLDNSFEQIMNYEFNQGGEEVEGGGEEEERRQD